MGIALGLSLSFVFAWGASWCMSTFVPEVTGGRKAVIVGMTSSGLAWAAEALFDASVAHPIVAGIVLIGAGVSGVAYGISAGERA